ncbi:TAXI family TRAP transporter solute-binding subunit [Neobacillus mesonae]|uniref:TAXI family TRAP transporter solute-binding subunit n=1 Tax=Neobacillus mesonae TaxID=1193713 RepID=UPI00203D08B4|nr:TAXI family TRAP transporter solute-binding subunit [Neobacillus mesonae]MCM3570544.1 TAXI family TRAP transporter solute-binding subunit [Neobacillus mesonae]
MRIPKGILSLLCIMLVFSVLLTACGGTSSKSSSTGKQENSSNKKVFVNIATATTAGVYYALGNSIAELWNKKISNVKASAQATAGTPQNIKLLAKKEAQVAFAQNGLALDAWEGRGVFAGKPEQGFRALTYLYPNVCYFVVRTDSGINSLADIKGKRIAPGPVGSGTEGNAREILSVLDIDYKDKGDAKAQYVGNAEASEMFSNNQVDVTFIAGGIPHSSVVEMLTSTDAKILPITGEVRDMLIKKYPSYFPVTIPANTFKNQTQPVETVAVSNMLIGAADLSDDVVYQMLDTMYKNTDQLEKSFKGAGNMKPEEGINGITVPLHPGAVKYFKEKGVQIPDKLLP